MPRKFVDIKFKSCLGMSHASCIISVNLGEITASPVACFFLFSFNVFLETAPLMICQTRANTRLQEKLAKTQEKGNRVRENRLSCC